MTLRLWAGDAVAVIDPDLGAGVVSLDWAGQAILSTGAGRDGGPFAQGMNLLLPFSNRISGPFPFDGAQHAVPADPAHGPLPLHGDAFRIPWQVDEITSDSARLVVAAGEGPFRYDASIFYRLHADRLEANILLTNRADITLPYGGGFHPWFPRDAATRVQFAAQGYWPEDARNLPTTSAPVAAPADWQFADAAPLPGRFINAGFAGWNGVAHVFQTGHRVAIQSPRMTTLLVYSPGPDAPFVCLEPVSHPVDAHNLPGQPGLIPLAPGRSMTLSLRLVWGPPDTDPTTSARLRKEIP